MEFSTQNFALTATIATFYYVLSLIAHHISAIANPEIKISFEAFIASIFGVKILHYYIMQRGIVNVR